VLLDVFDDVFLLDLPLEATEGILDRLALLDLDLGQNLNTPSHPWIPDGSQDTNDRSLTQDPL
jgi:hypothetical protein